MQRRRDFLKTASQAALGLSLGRPGQVRAQSHKPLPRPNDPDFWTAVRAAYPLTRERAYLNTGGLGPAPYPVLDVLHRTTMELQTVSETGHKRIEEARAPVAAFLGASPAEIAFTRNATEGNATVASGLEIGAGDEVIFESHAHPGGAYPWLSRQKHDGIRVKLFEPDPTSAAGNLERIERLITPRTRVIQVSHVTAPTGIRMPVEEIARLAHDRGCWFHVDGAQSAGMIPVDVHAIGCDSYATSGHKWLGAPHGTGILYVREESARRRLAHRCRRVLGRRGRPPAGPLRLHPDGAALRAGHARCRLGGRPRRGGGVYGKDRDGARRHARAAPRAVSAKRPPRPPRRDHLDTQRSKPSAPR